MTLFNEYNTYCKTNNKKAACYRLFHDILNELHIGLFKPRKGQCDLCCSFEAGNLSEAAYRAHISTKYKAKLEKDLDKEAAKSDEKLKVITMDVQAVLLSPKLNARALYYKSKLQYHNFTIFDLNTRDVECFFWHEGEGDLSSSSFASCIVHYIENELSQNANIKHIIN